MPYGIRKLHNEAAYKDFMKHKIDPISIVDIRKKYKRFFRCAGLWNYYCIECTIEELESLINWMCKGNYYESSDGEAIYIHGYDELDME